MDQGRPDPAHFVGRKTGPHSTATDGNATLHFPLCDRPGKRNDKVWVINPGIQMKSTEILQRLP